MAAASSQGGNFEGQNAEGNARQHNGHNFGQNFYTYNYHTPSPSPRPSEDDPAARERSNQLLSAAADGLVWRVSSLIEQGANVDFSRIHGLTALHYAAWGGFENCVAAILFKGADVNLYSDYGTALCLAAAKGHTQVVLKLLNERAKPDLPATGFGSALHVSSYLGHTNIVKGLLASGACPGMFQFVHGDLLRMIDTDALKWPLPLEQESGLGRRPVGRKCQPLMLAVDRGQTEVVDLLLKSGASATDHHDILWRRPGEITSKMVKVNAVNYASLRSEDSALFERLKQDLKRVNILVIGVGAAKDTFMSSIHEQHWQEAIPVLFDGRTCKANKLGHDGAWYCVVDTPSFSGDFVNDGKVLYDLSRWLSSAHRHKEVGCIFHGVIFVHSIASVTDQKKATGIAEVVANLIGNEALKNTAVVFTGRQPFGIFTLQGVCSTPLTSRGARLIDLESAEDTALGVLQQMKNNAPTVLQVQREIVDESKKFQDTAAGQAFTRMKK